VIHAQFFFLDSGRSLDLADARLATGGRCRVGGGHPGHFANINSSVHEGFLFPVLVFGLALSVFAIAGAWIVPFKGLMTSVTRLASATEFTEKVDLKADAKDFEVDLKLAPKEVQRLRIQTDQNLYFSVELPGIGLLRRVSSLQQKLEPDQPYEWNRDISAQYLFATDSTKLFLTNNSGRPATVKLFVQTQAEYPEAIAIPGTAAAYAGLVVVFLLMRLSFPRVIAVATTTAKEALAQPLYQILMAVGIFALLITTIIPYNTFGEDVKVLKDFNLAFIMLMSIFIAVWTASVGISDEIDGRTALTVLSKPIGRAQFLIGKFIGVLLPVILMFMYLGFIFLLTVSFKVVYDARESAQQEPTWQVCYAEMINIVPGLLLAFMEAVVMASISVAIATRLPMLSNLTICFVIYIVGHLLPLLALSKQVSDPYGIIQFSGQFFATVLPVLEHFNINAAIAGGAIVPVSYLGWAAAYCVLYSAVAMLFALVLFEDRDLA